MGRITVILFLACAGWACALAAPPPEAQPDDIPPLRPPLIEIPPSAWERNRVNIIVWTSAATIFGAVGFFLLRRALKTEPLSIQEEAKRALEELRRNRSEDLSAVSQNTRKCFAGMCGLPGWEMTTTEFCKAMEANVAAAYETNAGAEKAHPRQAICDASLLEKLREFLGRCDTRKFAPGRSLEPWDAAGDALNLVDEAMRRGAESTNRSSRP